MCNQKIAVITNGNYFARLILEDLLERHGDQVCACLEITGDYKARTGLHSLWAVGRATATPYVAYKVVSTLAFTRAQRIYPDALFSVAKQAEQRNIPVHTFVAVNTDAARSVVEAVQPDLLISVSCPQLIGRKMLSLAKLGGINIHSSLLPAYAGLAPYFWVLSRGEEVTGTTVHYMSNKFDEGNILVQKRLVIKPGESAFHLFKRLAMLGSSSLADAASLALNRSPGEKQDLSRSSYYSHPKFSAYRALRRRDYVLMRLSELRNAIDEEVHRSTQANTLEAR